MLNICYLQVVNVSTKNGTNKIIENMSWDRLASVIIADIMYINSSCPHHHTYLVETQGDAFLGSASTLH